MKRIFFVLGLLSYIFLTSPSVLADSFTFVWDKVTTDMNGAPIQELSGYKFYVSQTPGIYGAAIGLPTQETITYTQTIKGKYYAVVTAYNSAGESARSNEVEFNVVVSKPAVPIGLKFTQIP